MQRRQYEYMQQLYELRMAYVRSMLAFLKSFVRTYVRPSDQHLVLEQLPPFTNEAWNSVDNTGATDRRLHQRDRALHKWARRLQTAKWKISEEIERRHPEKMAVRNLLNKRFDQFEQQFTERKQRLDRTYCIY